MQFNIAILNFNARICGHLIIFFFRQIRLRCIYLPFRNRTDHIKSNRWYVFVAPRMPGLEQGRHP